MKKTFKKALAVLLVAVMVFGSAPLAGFVGIELPEFSLFGIKADAAKSGYFTYSVSNNQATITDVNTSISGSVTIPATLGGYPVTSIGEAAFSGCTGLTSITIHNSVTSIGDYAFYECTRLTSIAVDVNNSNYSSDEYGVLFNKDKTILVQYPIGNTRTEYTIPNSVTSIGSYAFDDCAGLTSITIPDSVTRIGSSAFSYCTGLTSVTIPDGVTSIGGSAFSGCDGLTSVTIPDSVTSIGNSAFSGCDGLTSVTIPDSVTSIGNSAFSGCDGLTSVTIPDSVTSIGNSAFSGCDGLTSVTIPDSVTSIGNSAFSGCDGLTSVTIPDSVTSIGEKAFFYCTGLTSVTIGNGVTSIGDKAFEVCTGLTSITVDESNPNYSSDEYGVLFNKDKTELIRYPIGNKRTKYIIPDSVTSIGYLAFGNCTRLTSVTIPDSVTSIGDYAFDGCNNLSTTYYVGTPEQWSHISIGSNNYPINSNIIFECNSERPNYGKGTCGDNLSWILNPDGELVIDGTGDMTDYSSSSNAPWYSKRSKIKSVTIGNSITSIGSYAFDDCAGLTNITIPDSVTSIGDSAFYKCTGLTSVTIPDGVTSIGSYAFYSCTGLTSVTIPDSVTSIGNYAFCGCNNLSTTYYTGTPEQWRDISIGSNNDPINGNIIFECNSDRAYYQETCGENLTWTLYTDGELVIDGTGEMKDYSSDSNVPWNSKRSIIKSATIGNSVTSICDYAFYNCTGLTSVTIPDSVTSIGDYAFYNCTGLTSVTIPDSVTSIGISAFNKCTGLTSVTISDSVTSIGDSAFRNCAGLTSVTIPNSVTCIGNSAFNKCTALTSVTIPDSVTSIGDGAFSGCNNIATTYYTGTPEQWRDISIGSNNNPINGNIIFECNSERPNYGKGACGDNLTWTLYTDGELVIDGTGDMTDYSGGSNVPWYSKSSKIKSATIGNGVTSIGRYAFYSCIGLTSVTIPDSITSIGNSAFYGCTGLTSVTIPDGVTSIGEDAFFYCTGLTSVTIPDSVTSIGERAFFSCEGLTSVTIPDGVTSIGNQAFSYCTGLISITIPDSVTSIGDYAFYGCTNLEKIEISAYSVEIADNAFDNSPKVILYCKSGSTVQSYAELNDKMYILIDGPASGFAVKNNQLVAYKGESENPQIPSGVTSIGANSFKDNGTVKTVELPNSVSSIFSGAFSNCSSLERIVVPHTVTTIAPDAFNGTNATIVCYANSYAHQYAVEKGMNFQLISITLNQTKVILSVGEYSIITATPEQEYLDSVQTSWKSSDTGVATVDANGKVTALSNGTATIYALAPTGETLATCSVQVGYSFRITIQNPSTKTISYKSGIILHATADNLPAGAKIVWEKDNDNFSMSDDGNGNCKIISKANGSTTFTVKVKLADGSIAKDSNGNEMSAQVTMNSKAGFFDKIVAFFKGLFGGNKVLPQLFKGIF